MKKINLKIAFTFFSSILIVGCGKKDEVPVNTKTEDVISVKVMALKKTDISNNIFTSGQFTTDDETILSFKTGGVINKIYVKEGDLVKKGQVLATLDLTEISALVNQAQLGVEKSKRDYNRAENLYKDSVATLEQFQNAKTGLELALQQFAGAKFNLAYSEIRATNDGVILKKIANEGQIIGSGMPVIQTSSKGQTDWILRVAVSDKEWANVSLNDKAIIQIDAINMNAVEGFIYSKSENADPMTGSFTLDIKLNNARSLNIASGMFGKAQLFISQKQNAWKIPYDALLDGNSNEGFVFVTNDDKKAIKVLVKISSINKKSVLISDGLANYKALIVSGSAYLTDKSSIKVVNN